MAAGDIKQYEFKKGQSGNPKGAPRKLVSDTNKELEAEGVKETSSAEIKSCYLRLINLTIPELEDRVKDRHQSALVRIVGKAVLSGKGFEIIDKMMDRAIGRAQQQVDHTSGGKTIKIDWRS